MDPVELDAERASAGGQAYAALRGAIIRGELSPGQALSENALAQRFKLSRTPIRAAIQRLEGDGLVRVYPQRGTVVAPLDLSGFQQAYFIRETLECGAVAEAATRCTPSHVEALARMLRAQTRALADKDYAALFALNERFHRAIMDIAGLPRVWTVVESAKLHLDRMRNAHLALTKPYPYSRIVAEHKAIVAVLAAHDADAARATMRTHLRFVIDRVELLRQDRPDLFALTEAEPMPRRVRA